MELAPTQAPRTLARRAVSAFTALVLLWLALVTLVPVMLGLDSKVVDPHHAQGYRNGTVVLTRTVPTSDLAVGSIVDLGTTDQPDLRSVVRTTPGAVFLRPAHDRAAALVEERTADWRTGERVVLTVPYLGLPLGLMPGWAEWALLGLLVLGTALLDVAPWARTALGRRHERPGGESATSWSSRRDDEIRPR